MARDSIIDTANENETEQEPSDAEDGRVKLTQRMPEDLVRQVDQVQDKYALPSRNAAINFIVKQGIKEL